MTGAFLGRASDLAAVIGANEVIRLSALGTMIRRLKGSRTSREGGKLDWLALGPEGLGEGLMDSLVTRHGFRFAERMSGGQHHRESPIFQVRDKAATRGPTDQLSAGRD